MGGIDLSNYYERAETSSQAEVNAVVSGAIDALNIDGGTRWRGRVPAVRKGVDYCDLSKFSSCCEEHVDVFCWFETLECWVECCAQLCSDTGVSSFVFAW